MAVTAEIPRTGLPDLSIAMLRDGYDFIGKRCRNYGTDSFRTRIMLTSVVCMTGPDAARLFYGGGRFTRRGAMPVTVLKLLQDRGSVQWLNDQAHRQRKCMFMKIVSPESVARLKASVKTAWEARMGNWTQASSLVLFDELLEILTEAACAWAGLPLAANEVAPRTAELAAMVEGSGSIGPRNWRGVVLRRRSERWARQRVERIRDGELIVEEGTPAEIIARHRDHVGNPLNPEVAAVELLNVLRPTVAVARFIVFAAVALHEHPRWYAAFADGDEADMENFVQEVRRLAPFFPYIGGRARGEMDWRGERLKKDQWVLLDLFGTCRDSRIWDQPLTFRPERFRERQMDAYGLIPQGGGDYLSDHRCPGDEPTVELMKLALRFLTCRLQYRLPVQDLSVSLSRIPALPKSRLVLADVQSR